MGHEKSRGLGILVGDVAFGQKGGDAGAPGRGGKHHNYFWAPSICVYFHTYPLKCFSFHWSFNMLLYSHSIKMEI